MQVTTVNPKGQVTIPETLRSRYGFPPGTKVLWLERAGRIVPIPLKTLDELRGSLGRSSGTRGLAGALVQERERDRAREDDA